MDDARFFQKLRAAFQAEAAERLASMEAALGVLEEALLLTDYRQHPEAARRLDAMYRELHSLKGAGRTVDLPLLETLCQGLETGLWRIKRGEALLDFPLVQLLRESVVLIRSMVGAAASGAPGPSETTVQIFLQRLDTVPAEGRPEARQDCPPQEPVQCPEPAPTLTMDAQSVRLPTAALEALLGQVEGLLTSKSAAGLHLMRARALREGLTHQVRRDGWAPDLPELERLAQESAILARSLADHQRTIAVVVDQLLESITQTLLLPWAALLEGYPRMIQEIAASKGRQVQFTVQGADASIDRRILEQLGDVFLHLLRNAVDHGIESPQERQAAGKPAQGRIDVRIEVLGGDRTRIAIADDGRGVDVEAVRRKAVQRGLYTAEDAALLDPASLLELIWRPEFSTRDQVDNISGRGLGMVIVKEKLERLGGHALLRTTPGQGSVVSLHLPLTLMRFQGLVILCAGRRFVVRKSEVRHVVQAPRRVCDKAENVDGMLLVNGVFVQAAMLARVLGVEAPPQREEAELRCPVLLVGEEDAEGAETQAGLLGLMVDQLGEEADVTLRGLGPQLTGLRGVRGVVLLGDGELAPVLDLQELRRMARDGVATGPRPQAEQARRRRPRRVLVAEDSITSRMLLKNVLETAGFLVVTAVDGQEALARLHQATQAVRDGQPETLPHGAPGASEDAASLRIDALVSDVEMPRMDGLELTRQIRADPALSGLPVVLVTSLADAEHQEAGMQAGADAYIVKSRFDQSDLLHTLSRLLPMA